MARADKYHPNYKRLYPGVEMTQEVSDYLRQSDRKMEYMEVDLKQGEYDPETGDYLPSREDSLERLADEENMEFAFSALSPEEVAVHNDEIDRLCMALKKLKPEEYTLIHALFVEQISQKNLAKQIGITQQGVSWKLQQILAKLKELLEI